MAIRSMPNTNAYRDGHRRIFGDTRPPRPTRCPQCKQTPCDPNFFHALKVPEGSRHCHIDLALTETCRPCNQEHPRGEPCPKCGRSLLLG